ncbi:molybdopterin-binding protein [uncultured Jannaschia sp.]|uniref:molybdopterin-binding protein n=1 Tax=uncultured Jannaschia sp. TaxID=293347 RepID=UPI00261BD7B0|nr:molybdopterin-binding protein [uncultured Jannaschia sp.]
MKFGPVPLDDALGAVLAHSVATPLGRLRKGRVLDQRDIDSLRNGGTAEVTVARLETGDIDENAAAARLAAALSGGGLTVRDPFTGRANLHAARAGVLTIDAERLATVNAVDGAITVATLPALRRVETGVMAATVKIIAYAVSGMMLERACEIGRGALAVAAPVIDRADLIVTELDGAATGIAAVTERLHRLGAQCSVIRVPHAPEPLAAALRDGTAPLRLILTASATSDEADVGPDALVRAGGRLIRFGMPVDPGNLLFLGDMPGARVVGLPGCARSPALNGADWVIEREICGLPVTSAEIAAMGVGGLLKEIPTRPQPRET